MKTKIKKKQNKKIKKCNHISFQYINNQHNIIKITPISKL